MLPDSLRKARRRTPKWGSSAAALVVLGTLAGCANGAARPSGNSGAAAPGTAGVSLGQASFSVSATDQLTFAPMTQHAHVGQVIEWSNVGTVLHTVTFDTYPTLSDASLQPGATWSVKFSKSGTYPYRCTIHPGMNGTLVVQ